MIKTREIFSFLPLINKSGLCYFTIFFVTSSKLISFVSLDLISSFSITRLLVIPYAYVFLESIDCILLSSFELKETSLISSVKTYLSLLNFSCVVNINLFFMNSLWIFLRLSMSILFFLNNLFYYQIKLQKVFIIFKFKFSFYDTLFCTFCFFIFTMVY